MRQAIRRNDERRFSLLVRLAMLLGAVVVSAPLATAEAQQAPSPSVSSAGEEERSLGLTREERQRIQRSLAAAGYDPGPVDGLMGSETREAIRRWQGNRGEAETGYLDADGAKALLALVESVGPPGTTFRDCPECPEMVVVPEGSFLMGSMSGGDDERPVHEVTIERAFAVGVYEVTFAEWDACVSGGGCDGHRPDDSGWGRGSRPVVNVSWVDAKAYVRWLSRATGKKYRLPSESEWEYVARAGTTGPYHFGSSLSPSQANFQWNRDGPVPVGSYSANAFGLYDVHGNVSEWVEDCWNRGYVGAPPDGSAWMSGNCGLRVLRGGSWSYFPRYLRSAVRNWYTTGVRINFFGFRVARALTP